MHKHTRTHTLARALTASTRAPVHMEPMLSINTSFFVSLATWGGWVTNQQNGVCVCEGGGVRCVYEGGG